MQGEENEGMKSTTDTAHDFSHESHAIKKASKNIPRAFLLIANSNISSFSIWHVLFRCRMFLYRHLLR